MNRGIRIIDSLKQVNQSGFLICQKRKQAGKKTFHSLLGMAIVFLFSPNLLQAQNTIDIFSLSGRLAGARDYVSDVGEKATESGSIITLNLPMPISEKTVWYTSINYLYFNIDNQPGLSIETGSFNTLHGFMLRTGLIRQIGDKQRLQLLVVPRLMSDMNSLNSDNWQLGGIAIYDKIYNNKLTLGYGAIFNYEYFGPYVVPVVNLNAKITKKLSINGLLPVNLRVKYQATDNMAFGFNHFGLTTTYRLNDPVNTGDYVERQCIDLSLFTEYKIFGNIYAEARIGRTFNRSYKQFDKTDKVVFAIPLKNFGDNRIEKNIPFKNGLFYELKLIYRININ